MLDSYQNGKNQKGSGLRILSLTPGTFFESKYYRSLRQLVWLPFSKRRKKRTVIE
jgi:hypothetical protein